MSPERIVLAALREVAQGTLAAAGLGVQRVAVTMAVAVAHAWAAATLRALQPRQSAELVCQRLRSKLVAVRVVQRRRSARGGDARLLRRRGQGETQGLG